MTNLSIAKLIALLSSLSAPVSTDALTTAVEEAEVLVADDITETEVNERRAAAHARRDARKAARLAKANRGLGLGPRANAPDGVRNGRNVEARAIRAEAAARVAERRAVRTAAHAERAEARANRAAARAERASERGHSAMTRGAERRDAAVARRGARGRGMR